MNDWPSVGLASQTLLVGNLASDTSHLMCVVIISRRCGIGCGF